MRWDRRGRADPGDSRAPWATAKGMGKRPGRGTLAPHLLLLDSAQEEAPLALGERRRLHGRAVRGQRARMTGGGRGGRVITARLARPGRTRRVPALGGVPSVRARPSEYWGGGRTRSVRETFSCYPSSTCADSASCCFFQSCPWSPECRDQHLPFLSPLPRSPLSLLPLDTASALSFPSDPSASSPTPS